MLAGDRPLPDIIPSSRTPRLERQIAPHPSLKPQHLLRILVRSLLPLAEGTILDPFMGSGSTLGAASSIGYQSIGVEIDEEYYRLAITSVNQLAHLYPDFTGDEVVSPNDGGVPPVKVGGTPSLFDD
jgi:site-specific DNA-methyltransferase (adenine-specific)